MSDRTKRNAVYVVEVPEDFKPANPWLWPDTILGAELYVKNLAITHCLGFVRAFNKRAIDRQMADRRWAIAAKFCGFQWEPKDGRPAAEAQGPALEPDELVDVDEITDTAMAGKEGAS